MKKLAYLLLTGILLSAIYQLSYGLIQLYNSIFLSHEVIIRGKFVNPDHFASYIASVIPLAVGLLMIRELKGALNILANITLVLGIFVLPVTYIRSSWLAVLFGVCVILFYYYRKHRIIHYYTSNSFRLVSLILTIAILVGALIFGLFQLKPDSANGRLFIWKITSSIIADQPFFGVGFGNFKVHYNRYQGSYFASGYGSDEEKLLAGNVNHAHNEYLQIATEFGIIGMILFLLFIWYLIVHLKINESESLFGIQVAVKSSITAILVSSLFTFPFHIWQTFLNFIILCLLFISLSKKEYITDLLYNKFIATIALLVLILVAFISIEKYESGVEINSHWNQAIQLTLLNQPEQAIEIYEELLPRLPNNGKLLFMYGAVLSGQKEFDKAIEVLTLAEKYYSDPNLFLVLGNCYKSIGNFHQAEKYYKTSYYIIPHKFYPLYKLMKLYHLNGEFIKANETAELIISSPVKIPSTAIDQMKQAAIMYLEHGQVDWY